MKAIITAICLIVIIVFTGCKNKAQLNEKGVPQTLLVAVFGSEDPRLVRAVYEPVGKYLGKKLNMPVEMIYTSDYAAVIEALKAKKVHIAYLSPFSYVLAKKNVDISPIIVLGGNGKPSMYYSNIITRRQSGINSMADVKARAKSLTMCFVDPESASGHLVPRAYLTSIGLNPDTAFKETIFAGGHLASVYTVKSGKVDIGCTSKLVLDIMLSRGMIKKDDIKILWTSDAIVSDPLVVSNDLNKNLVKKIQNAYLNMDKDAPQVLHNYLKILTMDKKNLSFMVAQDSFYNGVRKIAGGIKGLKINN
ncbi:MAG: phosphate/phosphite/phosphonate ABC transporter substrate-binding protein [Sphingobacteriales bacterium]